MAIVYLLHFERPYPAGRRPLHYMGVAAVLSKRVSEHRAGNPGKGGSLTRALRVAGIQFAVVRIWEFSEAKAAFEAERRIKRSRHLARYCPACAASPEGPRSVNLDRSATRGAAGEGNAAPPPAFVLDDARWIKARWEEAQLTAQREE